MGTVRPVAGFPESAGMVPTSGCGGRVLLLKIPHERGPVWAHFFGSSLLLFSFSFLQKNVCMIVVVDDSKLSPSLLFSFSFCN